MKIIAQYKQLSLFNKFVVNAVLLGSSWYVFFFVFRHLNFIHPLYEILTATLTQSLLKASQLALSLIGEESLIYGKAIQKIGGGGVYLDRGCLGRNLMGLFAGFIVAFPGRIDTKVWFIPIGLFLIFIINILRITGLYITKLYYPQYMDINHHTVFKYTVYALTFLLWYVWITKLRKKPSKTKDVDVTEK